MTQNEDSSARRWTKGRITLAISLALNLLVVGVVAGALLSGGGPGRYSANDPDSRRGPLREIGNAPFVRALEPADRQALLRALRDDGGTLRENRAELRRRFQALVAALRADPFDADAMQVLFDDQREAASTHQRTGERFILERLSAMSAEQRIAYADRLDAALKRGRRPRRDGDR